MKKFIVLILTLILALSTVLAFTACNNEKTERTYQSLPGLDTTTPAAISIAVPEEANSAMNLLANDFMSRYPNVTVTIKEVDNYSKNAVTLFKNGTVDMYFNRDTVYSENTTTDAVTGAETTAWLSANSTIILTFWRRSLPSTAINR